jgi:hypothetical protein
MGTKSRDRLYGTSVRMAAQKAAEARREADKLACDAWTKRMLLGRHAHGAGRRTAVKGVPQHRLAIVDHRPRQGIGAACSQTCARIGRHRANADLDQPEAGT